MTNDASAPTTNTGPLAEAIRRRRTFAIISHPDAGKTTLTEKLLLYGGAIHLAGSVKARRAERHATSDWMELEQERGISVTSSVMQFEYSGFQINLLDTPGHEDFSEDTFRTLVAADSAVMLLDNRRGVEERTRQLFEVCRLRRTPIFTFVNKCDRVGAPPLQLLSDVEADLGITCYPITWPIFDGGQFLGVYERETAVVRLFEKGADHGAERALENAAPLDDPMIAARLGDAVLATLKEELELLDLAGDAFSVEAVKAGTMTPVFFGSALTNFGVRPFLDTFLPLAPEPLPRETSIGEVTPDDAALSGFIFKIQANMDPKHRDRIAFVRLASGHFTRGMKLTVPRTGKVQSVHNAMVFQANQRELAEDAWAGDIVGIPNHGTLRIGDALTEGEALHFTGIPSFAPEFLRRVRSNDPMKAKHLGRALEQIAEEGGAQVFKMFLGSDFIVGVVGALQFDVLADRIATEFDLPCHFESTSFEGVRWVDADDPKLIKKFADANRDNIAEDHSGATVFLARNDWQLNRATQDFPQLRFLQTREQAPLTAAAA